MVAELLVSYAKDLRILLLSLMSIFLFSFPLKLMIQFHISTILGFFFFFLGMEISVIVLKNMHDPSLDKYLKRTNQKN